MQEKEIYLSEETRARLEKFTKSGEHNVHLVTRAKTILALDRTGKKDHLRISRISERLGISRQSIYKIRDEFLESEKVEEFLKRKERETPPILAKVTGEVEAHIIALACSKPPEGYARWSVRLLADKSVELNYVDSISYVTVHKLLKKRNISLI